MGAPLPFYLKMTTSLLVRLRWPMLLFLLLGGMLHLVAQQRLTFVSYNVENLFDTIPSTRWDDREYLPTARKGWTALRMKRKCRQLAEVISHVTAWDIPALIALQEVESVEALEQLAHHTLLRSANYKTICATGSDRRGSHVALLYDADRFALEQTEEWPLRIMPDSVYPTRNLLFVSGRLPSAARLSLIVCHLPSRRGGATAEEARATLIKMLRMRADSLLTADPEQNIIVLGDFNATPEDGLTDSWALPYAACRSQADSLAMVDLTPPFTDEQLKTMPPGSYYYRGYWERIDRLFVSRSLLTESCYPHIELETVRIALPPQQYMHETPAPWGRPRRTYGGDSYLGGPSDHLPLVGTLLY